jgi:hypothetical protein
VPDILERLPEPGGRRLACPRRPGAESDQLAISGLVTAFPNDTSPRIPAAARRNTSARNQVSWAGAHEFVPAEWVRTVSQMRVLR